MEGLTIEIYNWLKELDEIEAAELVSKCKIESVYIDTLFQFDSDVETIMIEVNIFLPLKISKSLEQYKEIVQKIEQAITESGESNGAYVRQINWKAYLPDSNNIRNDERGNKISEILTQEYVNKQIRLMNQSIQSNPHLAIGIAKELIETCCKYLLKEKGITYERDWDILKLIKETNKIVELVPFEVENKEIAKAAAIKILSGFSSIVHGVTELRNSFGSGHGHDPNFKMINEVYIKLAVSAAGELVLFYLTIHDAKLKNNNL